MVVKINRILSVVILLMVVPTVSASGAFESFGPSFECKKAKTEIEKHICKEASTSEYDAVMTYLYEFLLKNLTMDKRDTLIKEQKNWLATIRKEAFLEEKKLIEEKRFPEGWASRLDLAYADRIKDFFVHFKKPLESFLLSEITKYNREDLIPKPLKYSFFWYIFQNHDYLASMGENERNNNAFIINDESRMSYLPNGNWLIAYRPGNTLCHVTNQDGGLYQFFILNSEKKFLQPLKIQESYDPKNFTQAIQAYLIDMDKEKVTLGNGGLDDNGNIQSWGERSYYIIDHKKEALVLIK